MSLQINAISGKPVLLIPQQSGYVVAGGLSGGQAIYGGTDAGDDLILHSSFNATKGKIILGNNDLVFDEATGCFSNINDFNSNYFFKSNNKRIELNYLISNTNITNFLYSESGKSLKIGTRGNPYFIELYADASFLNLITRFNSSGQEFSGLTPFFVKNGRNTSVDTPDGFNFTVESGGATVTTTDTPGGTLFLKAGISTGSGYSTVKIQPSIVGEVSGDGDNDNTTILEVSGSRAGGAIGFFNSTPAEQQTLNDYISDDQSAAFTTGNLDELNQLRQAYETLRAAHDDLRNKLLATTLIS
jgi:hypothetical protein